MDAILSLMLILLSALFLAALAVVVYLFYLAHQFRELLAAYRRGPSLLRPRDSEGRPYRERL
jgi:cell division protein FtsL